MSEKETGEIHLTEKQKQNLICSLWYYDSAFRAWIALLPFILFYYFIRSKYRKFREMFK